jgi:deoxyribodipyrimidine photolyase-related protein
VYVPYDQVHDGIGPLARHAPREVGIVLVESEAKGRRRPYHQQKLALILANQRHFALEQAARGVAVRYEHTPGTYADALREVARETGRLVMMRAAERELRVELSPLVADGVIEEVPHEGWLTTVEDFEGRSRRTSPAPTNGQLGDPSLPTYAGRGPWRMDAFYKRVRTRLRILMEGKDPVGGRWSFDEDNREPWRGTPAPPRPPVFTHDAITEEVADLVRTRFADHPGQVDLASLPTTAAHAEQLWAWALDNCLAHFGPYEDAMSRRDDGLFHTRISALLNIHRLLPARVVRDAEQCDAPLNSREGFIRQVIGWREYVRHVHEATDGFTQLPDGEVPGAQAPGDGGYARWAAFALRASAPKAAVALRASAPKAAVPVETADRRPVHRSAQREGGLPTAGSYGGSRVNVLNARTRLPLAYWGAPSGLACLDHVVAGVWRDAWSHHIPRLMVLANIAALLDVDPRELTDWFWVAYADAYDWVVEPNVLGMGTYAAGPLMTTKPYVAGAGYIHRMSDYCETCAFDPKSTCPLTRLYWAYLSRHEATFARNQRMGVVMSALRKRAPAQRQEDERVFEGVRERLTRGERIDQP